MVCCEHCQTKNSLDSSFCKTCGREIPAALLTAAREENAGLIAEGYKMLGEGRTEEAELIARTVLEAEPNSVGGYSLLGMVYERKGEMVAALECCEKVLMMNPDSPLDKIKVAQLRSSLNRSLQADRRPSAGVSWLGGAAAMLVMGSLGAAFAVMNSRQAVATTMPEKPKAPEAQPFAAPGGTTISNFDSAATKRQPTEGSAQPGEVQPIRDDQAEDVPESNGGAARTANRVSGGNRYAYNGRPSLRANGGPSTLPNPSNSANTPSGEEPQPEVKPWVPPGNVAIVPSKPDPNEPSADSQGGSNPGSGAPSQAAPPEEKKKGVIEINVRKGGRSGGGESMDRDPQGAEAALKAAREMHLTGKYDGAAKGYEQARRLGKDSGAVNQKLGQALASSGNKSGAIAAYERAARKLEEESKTDPSAKQKLEATRQALKQLKGG